MAMSIAAAARRSPSRVPSPAKSAHFCRRWRAMRKLWWPMFHGPLDFSYRAPLSLEFLERAQNSVLSVHEAGHHGQLQMEKPHFPPLRPIGFQWPLMSLHKNGISRMLILGF